MNFTSLQTIVNLGFLIIVTLLTLAALLSVYIFVKYGRSRSLTVFISFIFGIIFVLQIIAAFAILQKIT